jgi:hypothetical protein
VIRPRFAKQTDIARGKELFRSIEMASFHGISYSKVLADGGLTDVALRPKGLVSLVESIVLLFLKIEIKFYLEICSYSY